MARIYSEQKMELNKLLEMAASNSATLVIPDLQRPFVWTPNQVTLLIDSLIRGWPFGTLLLWKVLHDEQRHMPSRGFWNIVDRTGNEGVEFQKQALPSEYVMVLDGQQRLQSLLVATNGDNSGFKLSDKAWAIETGAKSAKGRNNGNYWSIGSLCLDVDELLVQYNDVGQQLTAVEFDKVLRWAVQDAKEGRSNAKRPDNYVQAIPFRGYDSNKAKLIRFSRLWSLSGQSQAMKEKSYHDPLRVLLQQHEVDPAKIEALIVPLAELMTTLRDVKLANVTFLELSSYDSGIGTREAYDDAIVSIFTRLNTAGRTLTREEITFAWLKIGWNDKYTSSRQATKCFDDLLEELRPSGKKVGIDIDTDDLVGAASFIWAVAFRKGSLLANRDLLQGDIIRPMAGDLSQSWSLIEKSVADVSELARERGLEYRKHFFSVNALYVIWALQFLASRRGQELKLTATEKDDLTKSLEKAMGEHMDRWLICSGWANRWSAGSGPILKAFASDLAGDVEAFRVASSVAAIVNVYSSRLDALVKSLEADALSFVEDRLGVDSRELVRNYYTPLWIWHRLRKERWESSSKPLRIGKTKGNSLDVDHIVAVKIWEGKQIGDDKFEDGETQAAIVNSIGNCILLEKTFNISKSIKSLRTFMNDVHEVKEGQITVDDWAKELIISENLIDGDKADVTKTVESVREREKLVKTDLKEFITGRLRRVDI